MLIKYSSERKWSGTMTLSNKPPLLTIAIPTYNRPQAIQKQVQRLLPQLTEKTALVLIDNASSIDVETLFTREEKKKIKILRNHYNIGGDANIIRCVESSSSEWVYVLGDDDFINDTAVAKILDAVEKWPNVCNINFSIFNKKNEIPLNLKEYAQSCASQNGFGDAFWISKNVYNLKLLKPFLETAYHNITSMQPLLILVLEYLDKNTDGRAIRIKENLFTETTIGTWNALEWVKGMFVTTMYIQQSSHVKDLKKYLQPRIAKDQLRRIIKMQGLPVKQKLYFSKLILCYHGFSHYFLYFLYISCAEILYTCVPEKLFASMQKIKNVIIGRNTVPPEVV